MAAHDREKHRETQEPDFRNHPDYRILLRPLLAKPEDVRELDFFVDADTAALYGLYFDSDADLPHVTGKIYTRADVLFADYRVCCVPALYCDRCLEPVRREFSADFSHVIHVTSSQEPPQDPDWDHTDYLYAQDAVLPLAEAVLTDLRLEMPSKVLCKEDCLGLCPSCGENRNLGLCKCGETES